MKIVVVDDDFWIREELREALEKIDSSYEIVGMAENGQEGLELIRKQRPDLVITDIQMPVMDGLTMLSFVRAEGNDCKVLILSDHVGFEYGKRAIALGVFDYLYKPDIGDNVVEEFTPILGNIEKRIQKEKNREKFFQMEHIFLNSITGQIEEDEQIAELIEEMYGIRRNEPIFLYRVGLQDNYEVYHKMVYRMLEDIGVHTRQFQIYLMDFPYKKVVLMMLYHLDDQKWAYEYFKNTVTPMLATEVKGNMICSWGECADILHMRESVLEMEADQEWNLLFERGHMISKREIEEIPVHQVKYPYYLEAYIKEALLHNRKEEYLKTLQKYRKYCVENGYSPNDIKEILTRCFLNILHIALESGKFDDMLSTREWLRRIDRAVYWSELREDFLGFFDHIQESENDSEKYSVMVQTTLSLVTEYYDQGITLGEIAKQLCVTEAYLSTQLKKETGMNFTEIMKKHKIPHVKRLLLETSLKLNEIADQVGYSDAKYMSKVFKEEVGMLPAEYRKKNNLMR